MKYANAVRTISLEVGYGDKAAYCLFNGMKFIEDNHFQGACHAMSSVLFVALSEAGLHPKLCIGEARFGNGPVFDHSWLDLDGKPIDLAVAINNYGLETCPPVIGGLDVSTGLASGMRYGFYFRGLDETARLFVDKTPFDKYMSGFQSEEGDLWDITEYVMNGSLDIDVLRREYSNVKRCYMCNKTL